MTGLELDRHTGARLVHLAAEGLAAHLAGRGYQPDEPEAEALRRPGATFVTLERNGGLRGCVGTVVPSRPLWRDAVRNAVRAAADPRLPRVTAADWPGLDLHVSVLGPLDPIDASTLDALVAALRPGVDGLLLDDGERRATFLPVVWAKLPDPGQFVAALLAKGGWPVPRGGPGNPDRPVPPGGPVPSGGPAGSASWPDGLTAHRYTVVEFHDRAPRPPLT